VLHCLPPENSRGRLLQFHSFDESYVNRLRSGDYRTQEHFSAYFSALIKIKLASRVKSRETVEDLRQETFARFFAALRDEKILRPESLGSFINSICNNVLFEYYRSASANTPLDGNEESDPFSVLPDVVDAIGAKELEKKVREILQKLPERDRRILREVFLEERDKDEVCRELGVDRDYLRVLLHRAKRAFKASYLKHMKMGRKNPAAFQNPWNAAMGCF
jgi:RNA polymerase sigma-70 factor (ECF subfamily)